MKSSAKSTKNPTKSVRFRTEAFTIKEVKSKSMANSSISTQRSLGNYQFIAKMPIILAVLLSSILLTILIWEETILNMYNSNSGTITRLNNSAFEIRLLQPASESVVYTEDLSPIRLELFDGDLLKVDKTIQSTGLVAVVANLVTYGVNNNRTRYYNGAYLHQRINVEKRVFPVQNIQNLTLHRGPQAVGVDFWDISMSELLDCPREHSCGFHSAVAHVTVLILPSEEGATLVQHNLVAQDDSGHGGCASLPHSLQAHCRDVAFTFLLAIAERSIEEDTIDDSDISGDGNNETVSGFVGITGTDADAISTSDPSTPITSDNFQRSGAVASYSSSVVELDSPVNMISQQKGLQILSPLPESVVDTDQIQMTLCFPAIWLYAEGRLFQLHLIFDEMLYDVTALLAPSGTDRSAEDDRADILRLLSEDRNLTLTYSSAADAMLAAIRTMKSSLMSVRRCYYLDLKGVTLGLHALQLVAAFLSPSYKEEQAQADVVAHVAMQRVEILGAEAVRIIRR